MFHCVFLACLYKHKCKYTRKNNKHSPENDLHSQSPDISEKFVPPPKKIIFQQKCPIRNINCYRIKFLIDWTITQRDIFHEAKHTKWMKEKNLEKWYSSDSGVYQSANEVNLFNVILYTFISSYNYSILLIFMHT